MSKQPREASSVRSVKTLLTLKAQTILSLWKSLWLFQISLSIWMIICNNLPPNMTSWVQIDFCNLFKRLSNFCFTILHKNNNPHPIGLPERWLNMAEPFCSLLKIQYPIPSVRIHLWIHLFYFVEAIYKWYHIIYSFSI